MKQSILKKPSSNLKENEPSVSRNGVLMSSSIHIPHPSSTAPSIGPKNVRFLGVDLFKSDSNDEDSQQDDQSMSNNQAITSESRSYYRKSRSIPFKQINLYGNFENDSALIVTSPSAQQRQQKQQEQQQQQINQKSQNQNQFFVNSTNNGANNTPVTLQYQQLARGLRINSATHEQRSPKNSSNPHTGSANTQNRNLSNGISTNFNNSNNVSIEQSQNQTSYSMSFIF